MTTNPSPGSSPDLATPRRTCGACGYSVLTENWENHVLGAKHQRLAKNTPTPRPWKVRHYGPNENLIDDPDGIGIGGYIARDANVRLIVAAVNDYDRLRAIEAAARAMLDAAGPVCCDCGVVGDHGPEDAECLTLPLRVALQGDKP